MRTTPRLTTLLVLLLTAPLGAQDAKPEAYDVQMRRGEELMTRRQYEEALQAYKKAYGLKNKTSIDAAFGMAVAYRGLGAHKNVVDLMTKDVLALAAEDAKRRARALNLRGAALVALADKPTDKRYADAEADFLAAIAADPSLLAAQLNLGITLLKVGRDEEGRRALQAYVDRAPAGPEARHAAKMIEDPRRARAVFAPDFSFTSKDGEFISSDDLRGKTILLDFWGSWCRPCVNAAPGLVKLQKKFAEAPVVFLSVAENDRPEAWAAFIEKYKMTWPQFLDSTRKMVAPFGVRGFPTYIIIDGDGIVRWTHVGYSADTDGTIEREIKKTLKGGS